jgi:hypothetical protein
MKIAATTRRWEVYHDPFRPRPINQTISNGRDCVLKLWIWMDFA